MGLAATQGKLLFITARISNNEFEQQSIAYSKQRLANSTEQLNDEYLEAMQKTKYQILAGYNGNEACYQNVTYSQLTGLNSVAGGKQYLVKNNKGKVLVPKEIKEAFESGNGDYNIFLAKLGLTQVNVDFKDYDLAQESIHNAWDKYLTSIGQGADDKDGKHILSFGYHSNDTDDRDRVRGGFGYPTYNSAYATIDTGEVDRDGNPIMKTLQLYEDEEGYYTLNSQCFAQATGQDVDGKPIYGVFYYPPNSKEPAPVYIDGYAKVEYNPDSGKFKWFYHPESSDGTAPITECKEVDNLYIAQTGLFTHPTEGVARCYVSENIKNYVQDGKFDSGITIDSMKTESTPLVYEGATAKQRQLYDYACAITSAFVDPESQEGLTYDAQSVAYYKNIFTEMSTCGYVTAEEMDFHETNLKDEDWFLRQLKSGNLKMYAYSATDNEFKGTTLDDDGSIVEKEDKAAMVLAERKYKNRLDKIEHQETQMDMELNKLEAEHNAMQTEYQSLESVIKKNVEKSFNVFG